MNIFGSKLQRVVLVMTIVTALSSNLFAGAILYAVSGAGFSSSSLYTVDVTTGAATLVGATGFDHIVGIDFHPTTGVLYGVTSAGFGAGPGDLVTIDTATGAATKVGADHGANIPDISFRSDGTLFGWVESVAAFGDDLGTIDLVTGAVSIVGPGTGTVATGLALDSSDTLYMKAGNTLYTVDPLTGFPTFLGSIGGTFPNNALAFDGSDLLYSIERGFGTTFLTSIDIGSLSGSTIGDMGVSGISALAFSADVPEPTTGLLLGVGLVAIGWVRRRRRQ